MRYLQNIVLLIGFLGAAPAVLAVAPSTESSGVEIAQPNGMFSLVPQHYTSQTNTISGRCTATTSHPASGCGGGE